MNHQQNELSTVLALRAIASLSREGNLAELLTLAQVIARIEVEKHDREHKEKVVHAAA